MSILRCNEPGYELCAMNDPQGRRGIWKRIESWKRIKENSFGSSACKAEELTTNDQTIMALELCGGREGDDDYVKLEVGQRITSKLLQALDNIFTTGVWLIKENQRATGFHAKHKEEERYLYCEVLLRGSFLCEEIYSGPIPDSSSFELSIERFHADWVKVDGVPEFFFESGKNQFWNGDKLVEKETK